MNEDRFWEIIAEARANGEEECYTRLKDILTKLPKEELEGFDQIYQSFLLVDKKALHQWFMNYYGYRTDDGFMDFCNWLIMLGKETYNQFLGDTKILLTLSQRDDYKNGRFSYFEGIDSLIFEIDE